jgi:diaminopimelate decarboxylase
VKRIDNAERETKEQDNAWSADSVEMPHLVPQVLRCVQSEESQDGDEEPLSEGAVKTQEEGGVIRCAYRGDITEKEYNPQVPYRALLHGGMVAKRRDNDKPRRKCRTACSHESFVVTVARMNAFEHIDGKLHAEGVAVETLAESHGTPLFVYSKSCLREEYRALSSAMREVDPLICYSIKANSNAAVVRTFVEEGAGVDVVSGGELFRARRAGVDASRIVFAGVGKTREEITYALEEGILFFTVESEAEARRISECALEKGLTGRIAFRVNPDVDPLTHKYVSTGKKESKFGLDFARAEAAYEGAASLPGIEIVGVHMHIGSQILVVKPFTEAIEKVVDLCGRLADRYASFKYIDIGGGLGIRYEPAQSPPTPDEFAGAVVPYLKDLGLSVVMEPGRSLVGNAGILVCRVQYVKDNAFRKFIIADAGMNDLIRPALYQAHHEVVAVNETKDRVLGDLVGPICESGDFIAQERELPCVEEDDLLAVMSSGAYGFVMSSTYNSRPRAAEVMVEGNKAVVVRERETWDDLVAKEI